MPAMNLDPAYMQALIHQLMGGAPLNRWGGDQAMSLMPQNQNDLNNYHPDNLPPPVSYSPFVPLRPENI